MPGVDEITYCHKSSCVRNMKSQFVGSMSLVCIWNELFKLKKKVFIIALVCSGQSVMSKSLQILHGHLSLVFSAFQESHVYKVYDVVLTVNIKVFVKHFVI